MQKALPLLLLLLHPQRLPLLQQLQPLHPQLHLSAAQLTSSAMCSCWAVALAVIQQHSVRLTSA
jgi:hypothetical protein